MKKIERLMGIVLALNKNGKMTAEELAEKFEVDVRTVYRDIQALSELNVPIISQSGPEGGYLILNEYFIPSIALNKEEAFSLLLSQKLMRRSRILGYMDYQRSAFLKIENVTSLEEKRKLEKIESRIIFESFKKHIHPDDLKYFSTIIQAIDENKKVKIIHLTQKYKETKENIIEPYGLIYDDEVWQLAFKPDKDISIIHMPINHIIKAELLEEAIYPLYELDLNKYYCDNFCVLPGECRLKEPTIECKLKVRKAEEVKIKINKRSYSKARDYLFFHDRHIIEELDGYIVISSILIKPDFYVEAVMKLGDSIEIMEPYWLRQKVLKEIEKIFSKYKNY